MKDSPAFLGNRIGFQFLNEAMLAAQEYQDNGGIDYIDSILGPFSGRSMAPLVTCDFVGLDVHKAIVDNLHENLKVADKTGLEMPGFSLKLIGSGKLGRKTKGGLYKTQIMPNGEKKYLVYDIATDMYRERINYNFSFAEKAIRYLSEGKYYAAAQAIVSNKSSEAEICTAFMLKYVFYALNASIAVGQSTDDADDVMANGFNWCPPQALLEWLKSTGRIEALVQDRLSHEFRVVHDVDVLMKLAKKSKYDYRRYLHAMR